MRDLAGMIESLAQSTAKGFASVDKRFEQVDKRFEKVENEIKEVKELVQVTRHEMLDIGDRFISRMEFDSLLIRFNKIEQKVMSKSGK